MEEDKLRKVLDKIAVCNDQVQISEVMNTLWNAASYVRKNTSEDKHGALMSLMISFIVTLYANSQTDNPTTIEELRDLYGADDIYIKENDA